MSRPPERMRDQQLLLAATASLIFSFAAGLSGTAVGYQISIYDDLTPAFWVALTGAFVLFSVGLLRASVRASNAYIATNLLGMTMLNAFVVALPALKYMTYYTQWDVWIHLGQAMSIARFGHVNLASYFYPSLDFFWVAMAETTGAPTYVAGQLLGAPLEALKIPLTYAIAARLFRSQRVGSLGAMLSTIPDGIVGMYPAPWFYALTLLLVLVLVLVVRTDKPGSASSLLTIVVSTSFVLSHPLGPVFLVVAFMIVALWAAIRKAARRANKSQATERIERSPANLGLYALVVYVAWISLLTLVLQVSLSQLIQAFTAEGVVNPVRFGPFFTLSLLLRIFGAYGILGVYWLAGLLVLYKAPMRHAQFGMKLIVSLTFSGMIVGLMFEGVASPPLLGDFVQRPLDVMILFLPILGGLFLARSVHFLRNDSWRTLATHGAIVVPFLLAAAAMYPSPYVALFNYQNTRQLYSSIDWTAVNVPQNSTVLSNSFVGRYAYYPILAGNTQYTKLYHLEDTLPANLSQLTDLAGNQTYLVSDKETVVVAGMDLRAWTFPSPDDTAALRNMSQVELIYDNGEVQVYHW